VKTGSFLQDIIDSIVSPRVRFGSANVTGDAEDLCRDLLSTRGDVSGKQIASAILKKYQDMDGDQRLNFFRHLTDDLDLDANRVQEAAADYAGDRSAANLKTLLQVSEPPRQELLRRLNRVPGATQALVSMRSDLLAMLDVEPALKRTDLDFQHLLASWFNRGFLVKRPISWETPANILAKIIQYEAVHAINDWNDLKRRLEPVDRRCFAFFHPSMPDEPLVFVEIALCKGVPGSVQAVLDEKRDHLEETDADTAVFYSISNCQNGLRGVSFGSSLIKQVANDLSAELPNLKNFVTLSPIPGLVDWLETHPEDIPETLVDRLSALQEQVIETQNCEEMTAFENELRTVTCRYLLDAKRSDGQPKDAVARFHLGNGASVYQVHAMADVSEKGIKQSLGMMVNYFYDMPKAETQHEDFATQGIVHASRQVRSSASVKLNNDFTLAKTG